MKRIRSFFGYLAAFAIIIILLSAISSIVILKFFGNDLTEYSLKLLNEQLDTEVSFDEIGLNPFKNFPATSIYLKNLVFYSGYQSSENTINSHNQDTLIGIRKVYLEFDMIQLMHKNIVLRSVKMQDGLLNLSVDSEGYTNYHILKNRDKKNTTEFELNNLEINDIKFAFINNSKKIRTQGFIKRISASGNFSRKNYQLNLRTQVFVDVFENHGINFLARENIESKVAINVDENLLLIEQGEIEMDQLSGKIMGKLIVDRNHGVETDLHITTKNISLFRVNELLQKKKIIPGIYPEGTVNLQLDVSGLFTSTLSPHIYANFQTKGSALSIDKLPDPIKNIEITGTFTNGIDNSPASSRLNIKTFSANILKSNITGNIQLSNLLSPELNSSLKGEIMSSDLKDYLEKLPVVFQGGNLFPSINLSGNIIKMSDGKSVLSLSPTGSVRLNNIFLRFKNQDVKLSNINGNVDITEENMKLDLKGFLDSISFNTSLLTTNLFTQSGSMPYFVSGTFMGGVINLDNYISSSSIREKSNFKKTFYLPESVSLNITFSIDKLIKGNIESKRLKGTLSYSYPTLKLDPVDLETMNGHIHSEVLFSKRKDETSHVNVNSDIESVDINNIFSSFDNFGQSFLTKENIRGSVSGSSKFFSELSEHFIPISNSIVSENYLVIENGELLNFKPVMEMSKFLKIDQLDAIEFSTLRNTILIDNGKITIPEMDIRSSAINLKASGEHSFDNTYDYHLATKLSEYLFNKAKTSKNQEFEIALDRDDERTLFLHLYDTGNGMKIEYDEDQVMKKIKNDIREERKELKELLHTELGLFKNDSSINNTKEDNPQSILRFEFEDESKTDSVAYKKDIKSKWWKRKDVEDKKPEFKFVIDEDK